VKAFRSLTARVAVLDRSDVDTDQIIPKQFLKSIRRTGFEDALFFDWRYGPDGEPISGFELNRPEFAGAKVLVTGRNFGCGSSREHAAWALSDYGFEVVIAPSFGDIFRTNAAKNGLVIVELPDDEVKRLMESVDLDTGSDVTVDLERQVVETPDGREVPFAIDPSTRHRLLHGLDDIALTLQHEAAIASYEARSGTSSESEEVPGEAQR
jgi:3-isopropylmalate/(R)-2-methylmalate dehydratase small subunit